MSKVHRLVTLSVVSILGLGLYLAGYYAGHPTNSLSLAITVICLVLYTAGVFLERLLFPRRKETKIIKVPWIKVKRLIFARASLRRDVILGVLITMLGMLTAVTALILVHEPSRVEHIVLQWRPINTPLPGVREYVVQEGDSLWAISKIIGVELEELLEFNDLQATDTIEVGQVLLIPTMPTMLVTGDELSNDRVTLRLMELELPAYEHEGSTLDFFAVGYTFEFENNSNESIPLSFDPGEFELKDNAGQFFACAIHGKESGISELISPYQTYKFRVMCGENITLENWVSSLTLRVEDFSSLPQSLWKLEAPH